MAIKQGFLDGVKIDKTPILTTHKCHSKNYKTKLTNRAIDYVVLHYTGNSKDLALSNCKYFQTAGRGASAHFFVDEQNIYQSVSLKNIAWHCGTDKGYKTACTNDNSIGIEMCCSGNFLVSEKTQNLSVKLVAYIFKQQGWKISEIDKRVLRHYDVGKNNKKCPAQFVANSLQWTVFKQKIKKELVKEIKLQQFGARWEDIEHLQYIPMQNAKGETVSTAAKTFKWNGRYADAISNAELFDKYYKPSSGVVSNGVIQLLTETFGLGIKDGKKAEISYKNQMKAQDWLGAYPMLVRNGKVAFDKVPTGLGGFRGRTAFAYNATHFAFFWVKEEDGCELDAFAMAIIEKGFTEAINVDGGGSTSFATPGVVYEQNRKVRGKFGMWIKGGTGNKLAKNSPVQQTTTKPAAAASTMQQDKTKAKGVKLAVSTTRGLNLRASAPDGRVKKVIPYKEQVNWYGYYVVINGTTWYYIQTKDGTTGYASSEFLK